MDLDAYIKYNQADVRLCIQVQENVRGAEILNMKERFGRFWRVGLWLMDHGYIRSPFSGTK